MKHLLFILFIFSSTALKAQTYEQKFLQADSIFWVQDKKYKVIQDMVQETDKCKPVTRLPDAKHKRKKRKQ
jgi:hypothetical protein